MMTNEQAVEYAKRLKEFCGEQKDCDRCPFVDAISCVVSDGIPLEWTLDD